MGCGSSKSVNVIDTTKPSNDETNENVKEENGETEEKEDTARIDTELQEKRKKFEQEALESHNSYRAKHGAPEMTLNPELCKIAQKWADHLAAEKAFEHSKKDDRKCSKGATGENLYYSGSTGEVAIHGADAVKPWYDEIKDYDFEKPGFAMATGHFTQVVWKQTVEFGTAFATYQDDRWNKVVVVANYYPAGNMMGAFEDNVQQLDGK